MNNISRRVLIIQRRITKYREPFFTKLQNKLDTQGIGLDVYAGAGTEKDLSKGDQGHLSWINIVNTKTVARNRISYLSGLPPLNKYSQIIVPHENLLLNSHLTMARHKSVILWGHGSTPGRSNIIAEKFKHYWGRKAAGYLVYTQTGKHNLIENNYREDKIKVLNNTVETSDLEQMISNINDCDVVKFINDHKLSSKVGVFIGSLYKEKKIDFLMCSLLQIREAINDFTFIFVGDGPEKYKIVDFCSKHEWAVYLGRVEGANKALVLAAAKYYINPGRIGLGVIDAFHGALPIFSTDTHYHAPEVNYAEDSALFSNDNCHDFSKMVITSISNHVLINQLSNNSFKLRHKYSIEKFVQNFTDGLKLFKI